MSKECLKQFDELAKATFAEITKVTNALDKAAKDRKAHPMKPGLEPEYAARAAKYEGAYQEAQAQYNKLMRNLPGEVQIKANSLRKELERAVIEANTVNTADIDRDVLTLLDSGIMNSTDFAKLMSEATSATMRRLIAKYANEAAAKAEEKKDRDEAQRLRNVVHSGGNEGNNYLQAFDSMNDTFNRTLRNHAMIKYWDSLTQPIIDSF